MAILIATLNINGLREENKRMSFIQWLLWLNVDILCLQETYIASRKECNVWFSFPGYKSVISPGSNHCRGSVILYRKSFTLRGPSAYTEGRLVLAEFAIRELSFRVFFIYAPNQVRARNDFLEVCSDLIVRDFLLFCWETLIRCLTGARIGAGRTH